MPKDSFGDKINDLSRREEWEKARRLLEGQRKRDPENHWVLTQLGAVLYEQRRYAKSLPPLLASLKIVPDCPLTLWHLAGTLDALGQHTRAARMYTKLLESKTSPEDDPCWESKKWTEALKADCLYRLGLCFQHLGKKRKAEHCFHQYLNLLLIGMDGLYSIEDVQGRIRDLHPRGRNGKVEIELRKAVHSALQAIRA